METSAGDTATAKSESLLKWINTYVHCSSVEELSSGRLLLECVRKITPDLGSSPTKGATPWEQLFSILEEFCGCTLERAVDVNEILTGNQEHIARVVVLLLSVAVQNKNNSSVISAITSLDYEVQRDLMFFIESTLTKVKSHAIVAGTFTSGVGEVLPSLGASSPASSPAVHGRGHCLSPESSTNIPAAKPVKNSSSSKESGTTCSSGGSGSAEDTGLAFATPRKPPRRFFNGLDSPAGAMLLMSPAITGRRRPGTTSMKDSDDKEQEISRLKHSVRVLEGTLQVEKKLVQEYYEELCSKMEELESVRHAHTLLERKMGCLQNMTDLQDELSHTTAQLASAEKAIVNYQNKIVSLEGSREKLLELEGKLGSLEYKASKCEEYKLNMKKSESLLIGKTGDLKRAELQISKLSIELDAKTARLETLLQESEEYKKEVNELKVVQRQLEASIHQLELELTKKDGERLVALEQSRELGREVEILKSTLETKQTEVVGLASNALAKDTSIVALEREKVELQKEIAVKKTEFSAMELDVQSRQKKWEELENKYTHLQSSMKTLEHTSSMKEAKLQRELSEKMSQLVSKECDIKTLENIKKTFENERILLLDTTETLRKDLSDRDAQLSSAKKQIQVLEETTKELDKRVNQLHSTNRHLEQEKLSNNASADIQIKSLDDAKQILEASLSKSQSLVASLEREVAMKTEELVLAEHSKKELEAQVKALEQQLDEKNSRAASFEEIQQKLEEAVKHQAAMEEDTADMVAQLKFNRAKIKSLDATKLDLEALISELRTNRKSMEEDIASKMAELAGNQGKIVSLTKQRDSLIADVAAIKKELNEKQNKILQYESEESTVEKLKEECSQLQEKVSHLTQWVSDLQSSLETSKNHNSSLKNQKSALESRCSHLEIKLSEQTNANRAKSETISEYDSKLKLSEQMIVNLQDQKSSLQGDLEHHHSLHTNQAKLMAELDTATERERELASRCQLVEADLVMERSKSYKLQEKVVALEAQLAGLSTQHLHHTPLPQHGAVSTSTFIKDRALVSLSLPAREEDCASEVTSSEGKADEFFVVTGALNEKARVKELKRRNKQALPHLKSSYPIEMQVRPETPTTSNERLKGSKKGRGILCSSASTEKLGTRVSPTPVPEVLSDLSLSSYSSGSASPRSSPNSPLTSPRSSAAAVKVPRKSNDAQPSTLSYSYNTQLFPLRDFLDKKNEPTTARPTPPSTKFEIAFSPPKTKGGVPKRLQENRVKQNLKDSEKTKKQQQNALRKETARKSKRAVSSGGITRSHSTIAVHTANESSGRKSSLTSKQKVLRSRN